MFLGKNTDKIVLLIILICFIGISTMWYHQIYSIGKGIFFKPDTEEQLEEIETERKLYASEPIPEKQSTAKAFFIFGIKELLTGLASLISVVFGAIYMIQKVLGKR